jgi:hypothetical protein
LGGERLDQTLGTKPLSKRAHTVQYSCFCPGYVSNINLRLSSNEDFLKVLHKSSGDKNMYKEGDILIEKVGLTKNVAKFYKVKRVMPTMFEIQRLHKTVIDKNDHEVVVVPDSRPDGMTFRRRQHDYSLWDGKPVVENHG